MGGNVAAVSIGDSTGGTSAGGIVAAADAGDDPKPGGSGLLTAARSIDASAGRGALGRHLHRGHQPVIDRVSALATEPSVRPTVPGRPAW